MAALNTVQDYVTAVRILVQDQVPVYRYADGDLVEALNEGILDANRIRPDLFLGVTTLPSYVTPVDATVVAIDPLYRVAFTYYMAGWVQLRDEEYTQDSRAAAFMNHFNTILTSAQG
jgi:hypothetical protein